MLHEREALVRSLQKRAESESYLYKRSDDKRLLEDDSVRLEANTPNKSPLDAWRRESTSFLDRFGPSFGMSSLSGIHGGRHERSFD